jgi:TonB family protein
VWSLGVLLFSLRLAWGCKQVSSLRRQGTPAESPVLATVASVALRLGLTRPVRVLITSIADGPSVIGWIRPVVLLPSATLLGLTPEQLEAVLAHELAHIRRHDYLVNVLQILVETLLFYHPAVWWMSERIRQERELCCDDLAVASCGDALCYARALTRIERLRVAAPALAMASTGGPLLYRIQRLIGTKTREYSPSKLPGILALCLGLACFAINIHWARGQSQEEQHRGAPRLVAFAYMAEPDGPGVSIDLGGAAVLHRTSVEYPGPAWERGIQGTVTVEVTIDPSGDVGGLRVLSGPPELRRVVLQSVLQWHFQPNASGGFRQISVTFDSVAAQRHGADERAQRVVRDNYAFTSGNRTGVRVRPNGEPGALTPETAGPGEELASLQMRLRQLTEKLTIGRKVQPTPGSEAETQGAVTAHFLEAEVAKLQARIAERQAELMATDPPTGAVGHRLARIDPTGFSGETLQALMSRLPVHLGDILTERSIEQIVEALRSFDERIEYNSGWRLIELEGGDFALRIVAPNSR